MENQYKEIDELMKKQNGIIRTKQVVEAGIAKHNFYLYASEYKLEQVAHGIYVSKETWMDAMYILYLRSEQIIYSHDTALFFHDLTNREPLQYTVTMKTGYNPSRLKADGIKVYTMKREFHNMGRVMMKTSFGHEVPVYDMERTVCDLIRNRSNIEIQTFQDALRQYVKRTDKNLRILMQYANVLHVERILRQYLEVLI